MLYSKFRNKSTKTNQIRSFFVFIYRIYAINTTYERVYTQDTFTVAARTHTECIHFREYKKIPHKLMKLITQSWDRLSKSNYSKPLCINIAKLNASQAGCGKNSVHTYCDYYINLQAAQKDKPGKVFFFFLIYSIR